MNQNGTKRIPGNIIWLWVLSVVIFIICGSFLLHKAYEETHDLNIYWTGRDYHIASARDGPFIVTHLYKPWDDHEESAVAQLSEPIAIIDSRGHYFTETDIENLTWVNASGKTISPPKAGAILKAFYLIPRQTPFTSFEKK